MINNYQLNMINNGNDMTPRKLTLVITICTFPDASRQIGQFQLNFSQFIQATFHLFK